MARTCTVCVHAKRDEIDAALVQGTGLRDIAGRYGVSKSALERHKADHLPATLTQAREAAAVAHADDLLGQVRTLHTKALTLLERAEGQGDLRVALMAIGQARANLELLAKLLGELDERPQVNIALSAEWASIRLVLLDALTPFPDARAAVATRLMSLEVNGGHRR